MQRARFLLLSDSGKGKIGSDLNRGVKENLWNGLKAKVRRRSCTLRFFFYPSLSELWAASWWLRLTWLWPPRLGIGSCNSALSHWYVRIVLGDDWVERCDAQHRSWWQWLCFRAGLLGFTTLLATASCLALGFCFRLRSTGSFHGAVPPRQCSRACVAGARRLSGCRAYISSNQGLILSG